MRVCQRCTVKWRIEETFMSVGMSRAAKGETDQQVNKLQRSCFYVVLRSWFSHRPSPPLVCLCVGLLPYQSPKQRDWWQPGASVKISLHFVLSPSWPLHWKSRSLNTNGFECLSSHRNNLTGCYESHWDRIMKLPLEHCSERVKSECK